MNKNIFGWVNIINILAMISVVGGILICSYYKDSPQIVNIASLIALAGWMVDRGMAYVSRYSTSRLVSSEETDLSFLRQIRRLIKDGHPITKEHISVSESASKDADKEYQRVHGFCRPLTYITVGRKKEID
ncbi:hypothetical protein [uncultured Microbulbifer sp.]|uniref:hypothetical protein n=1 Tax=uncultured Microbulbifer sp. TaxID=348147 RepID=UPI0026217B34|nr:hypothetical protein [uncultured Microbulbifer sp.]